MPSCRRCLQSLSLSLVFAATLGALPAHAASPARTDPLHAWMGGDDPAQLEQWVNARLAAEQASVARLLAVKGKRTLANTLQPFDEAQNQLMLAMNQASLMFAVGQSAALRDKAQALTQKISTANTDLNLNRPVYDALAAVPLPAGDAASRQYLSHTLLEYRLSGVDKDQATRDRVHALQDKITELSLVFGRNVQDGTLTINATRAELAGLPEDYVARHKPNADGGYTLSTDEPDSQPVMNFASDAGLRRRMYLAYNTRAYPANKQVLLDLLAARQELATLLGFPTWADLATSDQMSGSAATVRKLLDDVDAASRAARDKEFAQLMAFAKSRDPGITALSASDASYWNEQYRRERYAFDAQSVRPYFPYDRVEAGILDAAAKIFHVQFRQVKDAQVWHPSVTVFDVIDRGRDVGRIYLDMHPREGKDKWFSSSPVVPGIAGRQKPEGMLTCNFSGGVPGDPGLMLYNEVITYFHEFGHLMHHILGGQNRWAGQGGFFTEGDFVEAPSQMLEEFFHSYAVVAPFAKHYQNGAVLPPEVFARMNAAGAYGRGRGEQAQLFYGTLALNVHDRPVAQVDLDTQLRTLSERFIPFGFVEGNRMYASFTHLVGYSSNYYTYILDKVIALDFYARFDQQHPLDGPMTARYRKLVIEPGATKPAAQLVRDFLGRPQNMDAFKYWIDEQFRVPAR